jgi:hypothetical protein
MPIDGAITTMRSLQREVGPQRYHQSQSECAFSHRDLRRPSVKRGQTIRKVVEMWDAGFIGTGIWARRCAWLSTLQAASFGHDCSRPQGSKRSTALNLGLITSAGPTLSAALNVLNIGR